MRNKIIFGIISILYVVYLIFNLVVFNIFIEVNNNDINEFNIVSLSILCISLFISSKYFGLRLLKISSASLVLLLLLKYCVNNIELFEGYIICLIIYTTYFYINFLFFIKYYTRIVSK